MSYLTSIDEPASVVTPIDSTPRFPESLDELQEKYRDDIATFRALIASSESTAAMLHKIRSKDFDQKTRMSLLKMFRRCVSPVLDTEMSKKISAVSTESLIDNYGHTFKSISLLKSQFESISDDKLCALASLIGEYDKRGQLGYALTAFFFDWFKQQHGGVFTLEGPVGAGRDIELSSIFEDFSGNYPCDFVIRHNSVPVCVGFARYDSTRGGAQSDDRTGGNALKVEKAKEYIAHSGNSFKLLFVSDGPGLIHKDTWEEACLLDGQLNGAVRVTTLKLAADRVTKAWLLS